MKGGGEQNLQVALRIRPLGEQELLLPNPQIAYKVQDNMVVLMDPMEDPDDILRANRSREKQFVYDSTFDGAATQDAVYQATTKVLIPNVINGYNATVFAYGATGAGKTYTMLGTDPDPGIMARALNDLFLEMDKTSEDMAYKVSMSYLEIYNEMIRDLLNPSSGILDLREDSNGNVHVAGLTEVSARSTSQVMRMLLKGNKERTQEPTAANETSSRSHAVLQVEVKQRNRVRSTIQEVRTGKLYMVDLAGSERAANTLNRGKRMVEGGHINRSLLALGNCINALSDKNGPKYVNYRDSKLTRLLKDALGGNCKTVMIAHISPASGHFEESRNTLVYADRAKHIRTKVRRNVTDVSYHIAQYTNIISELQEEIVRLRTKLHDKRNGVANITAVHSEVVESRKYDGRSELNKLKEQLLMSFKDQMELRKSLMELNNATMEISLETNRNQLLISEWDAERSNTKRGELNEESENQDPDRESTVVGLDSSSPDSEEVRIAREELKVLHDEKHRTEKLRMTVQKELDTAKQKTNRLEEVLPQKVVNEDQREILRLLCKVHELEIENTEAQSACLIRDYQIRRKDMIISKHKHHRNLCDKIISQQKELLDDNNVSRPKDLEDLYVLYKQEREDKALNMDEADSTPADLKSKSMVSVTKAYFDSDQMNTLSETPELNAARREMLYKSSEAMLKHETVLEEKVFSQSPKAKQIQDAEALKQAMSSTGILMAKSPNTLQSSTTPGEITPREVEPKPRLRSPGTSDERNFIASNTRSIAALAARKKTKAQLDVVNTEKKFGERSLYRPVNDNRDTSLTPSRLAAHNKALGDSVFYSGVTYPVTEDNTSYATDMTLPVVHSQLLDNEVYFGGVKKVSVPESERKRKKRTKSYDLASLSHINKNSPRKFGGKRVSRYRATERDAIKSTHLRFPGDDYKGDPLNEFDESTPPLSHIPQLKPSNRKNRGAGHIATTGSDSSTVSTPQFTQKSRKPLPSIPHYRKGDISVSGFGLPK